VSPNIQTVATSNMFLGSLLPPLQVLLEPCCITGLLLLLLLLLLRA
jgi:hypothetical protein